MSVIAPEIAAQEAQSQARAALPAALEGPFVFDNFLLDPQAARAHALAADYMDWPGHDGQVYKRVCLTKVPGLQDAIESVCGPVEMFVQGYRLNYAGELPNQAIHSDLGWGTCAAVVYLADGPGGTGFWVHKDTGAHRIDQGDETLFNRLREDWVRPEAWSLSHVCSMAFNRAVIYSGSLFHSRYPFEAFGSTPQDGRLVAVAFFSPKAAQ